MTRAGPPTAPRPAATPTASPWLARLWVGWDRYWFAPMPALSLAWLRLLVFLTLLSYVAAEYRYVSWLPDLDPSLYRPVLILGLPGIGPIPPGVAHVLMVVLVGGAGLGLLGVWVRPSAAVCAIAYLYSVAQVYSFTNVHHGDSLLAIALFALALGPRTDALSLPTWLRGSAAARAACSRQVRAGPCASCESRSRSPISSRAMPSWCWPGPAGQTGPHCSSTC